LNIEKKKNETIKELLLLGIKYVKLLSQLPFSTIPIVGIFNFLKSLIVEYELFIVLELLPNDINKSGILKKLDMFFKKIMHLQ
jgi:hypothetical protein